MLVLFSGSSGSGKNTLIGELLQNVNNTKFVQSCTTREKRKSDNKEGYAEMYKYLSKEIFLNKISNNELFEYEEIHGNYYGVLNEQLEEVVQHPEIIFVKDIGVLGKDNILQNYGNRTRIITIYLKVPKDILKERLIARGESSESIEVRLKRFEFELSYAKTYDYVIENKNLEDTIAYIYKIIKEG